METKEAKTMSENSSNEELMVQIEKLKSENESLKNRADMYDYYRDRTMALDDEVTRLKKLLETVNTITGLIL